MLVFKLEYVACNKSQLLNLYGPYKKTRLQSYSGKDREWFYVSIFKQTCITQYLCNSTSYPEKLCKVVNNSKVGTVALVSKAIQARQIVLQSGASYQHFISTPCNFFLLNKISLFAAGLVTRDQDKEPNIPSRIQTVCNAG